VFLQKRSKYVKSCQNRRHK